ncbi:MAG: pyridoxamine 5'-phosphate oxidase family protein [Salinisphaeraceae bacterium]|nr:pyridoxamine 5'-phosphate oxidase family protein [Salinisphaeraceae bacterium]
MEKIDSIDSLRKIIGEPHSLTQSKITDKLTKEAKDFIAMVPLIFMATANNQGQTTVSPKGDQPGFVRIEDDKTLLIPERTGNKLLHGMSNIIENGHIGLIFLAPGTEETLRVNGRCGLYRDTKLCKEMAANGKPALLILKVEIEQCFFHCAKAFKRSHAWQPEQWPDPIKISFGKQIAKHAAKGKVARKAIEKVIDQAVKADYKINL